MCAPARIRSATQSVEAIRTLGEMTPAHSFARGNFSVRQGHTYAALEGDSRMVLRASARDTTSFAWLLFLSLRTRRKENVGLRGRLRAERGRHRSKHVLNRDMEGAISRSSIMQKEVPAVV